MIAWWWVCVALLFGLLAGLTFGLFLGLSVSYVVQNSEH